MKAESLTVSPWTWRLSRRLEIAIWLALAAKLALTALWVLPPHPPVRSLLDGSINFLFLAITIFGAANLWLSIADWRRGLSAIGRGFLYFIVFLFTGFPIDCENRERPNQAMESTASDRDKLACGRLRLYPTAMRTLARSDSSLSR